MYFLSTRYYVPEWGRFLSPDKIDHLVFDCVNGLNLYCYCINNPILYFDPTGQEPLTIFLIIVLSILNTSVLIAVNLPNAEKNWSNFCRANFLGAN